MGYGAAPPTEGQPFFNKVEYWFTLAFPPDPTTALPKDSLGFRGRPPVPLWPASPEQAMSWRNPDNALQARPYS